MIFIYIAENGYIKTNARFTTIDDLLKWHRIFKDTLASIETYMGVTAILNLGETMLTVDIENDEGLTRLHIR